MTRQLQNTTLNMPCRPCLDPKEVLEAIDELERSLAALPNGIGLAANQIGLDCQVAIIRSQQYGVAIDLVNPVIVKAEGDFINDSESCLSFPGRAFKVPRFGQVCVETSLVRSKLVELASGHSICRPITSISIPADAHLHVCRLSFAMSQEPRHYGGTICLAVQHEIDHLNGITIASKVGAVEVPYVPGNVPIVGKPKVGRNEPCPCGSGKKYKKCCGG